MKKVLPVSVQQEGGLVSLPGAVRGPVWESEVLLLLQEACGEHLGSVCLGMQLGPACGGCLPLPLPGAGPAHIPEGLGGYPPHSCLLPDL